MTQTAIVTTQITKTPTTQIAIEEYFYSPNLYEYTTTTLLLFTLLP